MMTAVNVSVGGIPRRSAIGAENPELPALVIYTHLAYMQYASNFCRTPPFQKYRPNCLSDEEYRLLQLQTLLQPDAGDVIKGTGGLRKLRFGNIRRNKGKRGGLRIIYYYWISGTQFWMFSVYDKDEAVDLSPDERKAFAALLASEIRTRNSDEKESVR